jgi:U6 snRNA-associated Sm-like protein LSm8
LVVTSDGRIICGILQGHDQVQNIVLSEANERVYSLEENVEVVDLGLYVIRGDNVVFIGDYTKEELTDELKANPLPAIQQHVL